MDQAHERDESNQQNMKPSFDLDRFVAAESVSRCGKKFSTENYFPPCEILKLRPEAYKEAQNQYRLK